MTFRRWIFVLALAGLGLGSPSAEAQIKASEPASMSQTIDGTVISVEYFRPRARGRAPLFGQGSVVWEARWTPGANWATALEISKPIELDGVALEAGTYGVWMDMSEEEFLPHELILEPYVRRFHTIPPPDHEEMIRLPVTVGETDGWFEMLTWDFEDLRSDGGTLALRWGNDRMAFDVKVEPSQRMTVTEEEAAAMTGMWAIVVYDMDGSRIPGESTMEISVKDDGTLMGDIAGTNNPFFNMVELRLMPVAEGIFQLGEVYDDEMRETWEDFYLETVVEDGRAVSMELRGEGDMLMMSGARKD